MVACAKCNFANEISSRTVYRSQSVLEMRGRSRRLSISQECAANQLCQKLMDIVLQNNCSGTHSHDHKSIA